MYKIVIVCLNSIICKTGVNIATFSKRFHANHFIMSNIPEYRWKERAYKALLDTQGNFLGLNHVRKLNHGCPLLHEEERVRFTNKREFTSSRSREMRSLRGTEYKWRL